MDISEAHASHWIVTGYNIATNRNFLLCKNCLVDNWVESETLKSVCAYKELT